MSPTVASSPSPKIEQLAKRLDALTESLLWYVRRDLVTILSKPAIKQPSRAATYLSSELVLNRSSAKDPSPRPHNDDDILDTPEGDAASVVD